MVGRTLPQGVKGRPQACVTCHRRKKGCDLQRPSCGQCRKACIPCGGYNRTPANRAAAAKAAAAVREGSAVAVPSSDPVLNAPAASSAILHPIGLNYESQFVGKDQGPICSISVPEFPTIIHGPPSPDLSAPLAWHIKDQHDKDRVLATPYGSTSPPEPSYQSPPSYPYSEASSLPTPPSDHHQDYQQSDRRRHLQRLRQRFHNNGSTDLAISGPVSRSAESGRLIGTFWESFLPNSQPFPEGTFQITLGGSVDDVHKLARSNPTLHKGLMAIALTTLGKQTQIPWMREEGFRLYGEALRGMSGSLRLGSWTADQMVVTRLFSVYEALHGADTKRLSAQGESWKVHSYGDEALITSKPPSTYITGVDHQIFSAGRHHLALLAIMARKRCFLSEPQWKWIPWTIEQKSPRDFLLDIVVDLPGILEANDAMNSWDHEGKKEAYRKHVLRAVRGFTTRLFEWHANYATADFPLSLSDELPPTISAAQLASGHVMSIYWAICMRVYDLERSLLRDGDSPDPRIDVGDCCTKVVSVVRIFLHRSTGMFRQYITPFPMSTALQYLIRLGPGEMVEEKGRLFMDMETPAGRVIKDFILSIEPAKGGR